jgi:hypothetical protein
VLLRLDLLEMSLRYEEARSVGAAADDHSYRRALEALLGYDQS